MRSTPALSSPDIAGTQSTLLTRTRERNREVSMFFFVLDQL
jgi:hypothetical protein